MLCSSTAMKAWVWEYMNTSEEAPIPGDLDDL